MKIALVNPFSFAYHGGVQEHIKALYKFLKKNGHEVKVLAPRQSSQENYGDDFWLFGSSIVVPGNDSRVSLSYCFPSEIEDRLNGVNFDVFHFHSFMPFLSFQVQNAVKSRNVAMVMTSHSNIEGSFFATVFGVVTELVIDSFVGQMDGVISVSKAGEKLVKNFQGPRVIIPNGIDTVRFNRDVPKIAKFQDGKINILFVGRLDRRKGLQFLLPAFDNLRKKYEKIRLIIVGDGFLKEEFRSDVSGRNIKDVIFAGEVKEEEMPGYYATADIFCAPSIRGETFGIILLEAMASGIPVVTTDIEGYREVVPKEAGEFLVKPERSDLLFLALEKLVKDKELRSKFSKIGLAYAGGYDWEIVGNKVFNFYQEIVKNKQKDG